MRIIKLTTLRQFWEEHPSSETALRLWYTRAKHTSWQKFAEVKAVYPAADKVGRLTVFNIGGNKYRLIVRIEYARQEIYIRHILTHQEYDKDKWKDDPGSDRTYEQLVATFAPRPISSDEQYRASVAQLDALLDKGELTLDEQDYLTALGMMVERYEAEREPDIELRGIALIRALMEEQALTQRDLVQPIFKTDSIASAVLHGKRRLTVEHIDKLAHYFQLPQTLFFEVSAYPSLKRERNGRQSNRGVVAVAEERAEYEVEEGE